MKGEAAFIFLAPQADKNIHKTVIETPALNLHVTGVQNYAESVEVAKQFVDNGVKAIELCGGFGNQGTAMVAKAVEGRASVGAVKFDHHPGLGFKSGDELFQ